MAMTFDAPTELPGSVVRLRRVAEGDFEALHAVAADPLIWEQHPNPDRWRREVFANFFQGALASGGAYLVFDSASGELIGSSRFYDHDPVKREVYIGYTFLARKAWGGRHNPALKALMLAHAFGQVDAALFSVGAANRRSRIAMERLGGVLVGEASVAYHGERASPNVIYRITRADWQRRDGAA